MYLFVVSLVLCTSCKSNKSRRIWQRNNSSAQAGGETTPSPRDYSVTKANAYNDIFLDSLAFEKFIAGSALSDSVTENMRDFYNVRNFQFAWFDSKGLNEQALGFRSLYKYSTDSTNKQLDNRLDELIVRDNTFSETDPSIIKLELQLTRRFVQFLLNGTDESMHGHDMASFVPIKKQPMMQLADSILSEKNHDNEKGVTVNPLYNGLKEELRKYVAISKKGGWDTIPATKSKFVLGKNFPELLIYKKRLAATGQFTAQDTTATFTPELEAAIKKYQETQGITPDGKITTALRKSLNISINSRIQQLLVNMERMHWLPVKREGKLILVNIPEFTLHVTDGNTHIQHMAVVVGKEGHTTTMFADDLEQIVFSPYWNIPPSIVKDEILPSMQKNGNYLSSKNMEITSGGGSGLPSIRQRPGGDNSLGRVKFLFPNSFNIYFHDTPSKSLFEKDQRAYSHGCIRLSDPVWMANYLLENSPEWTPEKIEDAMNSGVEKFVKLKRSVPVIITYYTAWIDENQKLNFRQDVYGNDEAVSAKMFTNTL